MTRGATACVLAWLWHAVAFAGGSPDLTVSDITLVGRLGHLNGTTSYGIGLNICNQGDADAQYVYNSPNHPVVTENLYRLRDGRFEQIGISWAWHTFFALATNSCGTCNGHGGAVLGAGCADSRSATSESDQPSRGPRSDINAATGSFPFPPTIAWQQRGDVLYKRLQSGDTDLDPAQNSGATYFLEVHVLAHDDAAAEGGLNNVSIRRVLVTPAGAGGFNLTLVEATQTHRPAITAWADSDPSVTLTPIDIPGDGRLMLGTRVTQDTDGTWQYEYALYNQNSHRAVQAFSVPISPAHAGSVGFHDVSYHSGEVFSGQDWTVTRAAGQLTWMSESFDANPNANALRRGTLYNFRISSNRPPTVGSLTLTLFRSGTPSAIQVAAPAPLYVLPADLNCDGLVNNFDVDPFVLALTDPAGYAATFQHCDILAADVNQDGLVNNFDVDPFVACLTAGACP